MEKMLSSVSLQPGLIVRTRLATILAALFTLLMASFRTETLGDEFSVKSRRHVSVICELEENRPVGTLVTRLLDHQLTLKNFRIVEPDGQPMFSVDSRDGAVRIGRSDQIDFESYRSLQLLVSADEELTEQDQFLKKFSDGLVDDGLAAGAFESLSSGIVTFEITIRLRDVPEPPTLEDANLVFRIFDETSAEAQPAVAALRPSIEGLRYFIIGGNEDDFFQIDPSTGHLSLRENHAFRHDMISSHELVILGENSAGLSATANAFITVFNETPRLSPQTIPEKTSVPDIDLAGSDSELETTQWHSIASPLEDPFGFRLKLHYEAEPRIPLIAVQDDNSGAMPPKSTPAQMAANENSGTVIPSPAAPVPNSDPVDTAEPKTWVMAPPNDGRSSTTVTGANTATTLPMNNPNSASPSVTVTSPSQDILQSLVALIVFVTSCIAGSIAISRASAARRAILEDSAARQAESLAAELLQLGQSKSDEHANCSTVSIHSDLDDSSLRTDEECGKIAALSEEICRLQNELATRDQLIAELRLQLDLAQKSLEEQKELRDQARYSELVMSGNISGIAIESKHPELSAVDPLSQVLEHVESHTRGGYAMTETHNCPESQFVDNSQSPPPWNNLGEVGPDYSWETSHDGVASLNEQDDLQSQLAELFAMSDKAHEYPPVRTEISPLSNTTTDTVDVKPAETLPVANPLDDEVSHLDSVKQYLSKLLERSKESTSPEDILVDRRKVETPYQASNRRSVPEPARKPVKSFLETYMSTLGGENSKTAEHLPVPKPVEMQELPPLPEKPWTPVDVKSARESMNSLRAVAMQSVEKAVLSYDLKQARGVIAVRTMSLAALILVTVIAFIANLLDVIQFSLLPWLMAAAVIFALVKLALKIHGFRKQRRDLVAGTLTAAKRPSKRSVKTDDLEDTIVK